MNSAKKIAFFVSLLSFGGAVNAAPAQVVDLSVQQPRATVNESYNNAAVSGAQTFGASQTAPNGSVSTGETAGGGSLFLQVQQLRDEVANLRGQLEEQAHTIDNLSRQQAEMAQRSSGSASATANSGNSSTTAAAGTSATANNDGREEYDAAYNLLKEKEYDKASAAFQGVVNQYPNSNYAGSSLFWLGFVYQTQGDMDGSAKAFSSLVERFPTHSKADDAKYNLGKIYNQQGKTEQARRLLKEVAAGNSKSAPLAKSYLESM
jgi:tol-pal system protein YbgF